MVTVAQYNATYLVTSARERKGFVNPADAAYFARPVIVRPLFCEILTRLVWVRDEVRGHEYWVEAGNLRTYFNLSNHQKNLAKEGRAE